MSSESGEHPIETLYQLLDHFGSYPPGVVPITKHISGTAFFPGGSGLWGSKPGSDLPPMPVGSVLVVGHNFDSETSFEASFARGIEHTNGPTWGPLRTLFQRVNIPLTSCFFTNAYMGLKAGSVATGLFPGSQDADFVQRCRAFMIEQIKIAQPRIVVTLGAPVINFFARLTPELEQVWTGITSLPEVDRRGCALVYPVLFPEAAHVGAVVALTHPAYRHVNVRRRRYKRLEGDEAEVALLEEALRCVGGHALTVGNLDDRSRSID